MGVEPKHNPVQVPKASLVGDDKMEAREPDYEVVDDKVKAQVKGAEPVGTKELVVTETHVTLDEVITDTSDPRAVQVPDAGMGSLDLPIHAAAGERVEDYFAREASKADEPDPDAGTQQAGPDKS